MLVNGAGGPLEGWNRVAAGLRDEGTVFAYNRLGTGGSDEPDVPQTGDVIVATLRGLLAVAGLRPPYVLVGHSLGGLYVNLYARLYPDEIAGVVFLEAAAPRDAEELRRFETTLQRGVRKAFACYDAVAARNEHVETEYVDETSRRVEAATLFPDVPLVVVSGGRRLPSWLMPAAAYRARAANQESLCVISTYGRHVIARRSGHFPQLTQPDIVVQAIREVAAASGSPSAASSA